MGSAAMAWNYLKNDNEKSVIFRKKIKTIIYVFESRYKQIKIFNI